MNFSDIISGLYSNEPSKILKVLNSACHVKTISDTEHKGNAVHMGYICQIHTDIFFEFIYLIDREELCFQGFLIKENKFIPPLGMPMKHGLFSDGYTKGYVLDLIEGKEIFLYSSYNVLTNTFNLGKIKLNRFAKLDQPEEPELNFLSISNYFFEIVIRDKKISILFILKVFLVITEE